MSKAVILTGLRANGEFHLGNYLGAILPMVDLQKHHAGEFQVNMFVPDLHSFTTPIDHSTLYAQTMQNLRIYAAAGLDIDNPDTFVYRQSYIPAHSELAWILGCFTYYGELQRMTQFKEKSDQAKGDSVSAALFSYPVLMAADILLYGAQYVPVGEDQRQHLELARDVGARINNKFESTIFTLPEPWAKQLEFANRSGGVRIRSLKNPEKKMSKSIDDPAGTILLSDDPEIAAKKMMSSTTDSMNNIHYDFDKQPGISNLLQILALLTNTAQNEVNAQWEGQTRYGDLKTAVAEAVKAFLTDFQRRLAETDAFRVETALTRSEAAMNVVANECLLRVQQAVGLRPRI